MARFLTKAPVTPQPRPYPSYLSPTPLPTRSRQALVLLLTAVGVFLLVWGALKWLGSPAADAKPPEEKTTAPAAVSLISRPEAQLLWAEPNATYRYKILARNQTDTPLFEGTQAELVFTIDVPTEGEVVLVKHQAGSTPEVIVRGRQTTGSATTELQFPLSQALLPQGVDEFWLYTKTMGTLTLQAPALAAGTLGSEIAAAAPLLLRPNRPSLWLVQGDASGKAPSSADLQFERTSTTPATTSVGWVLGGTDHSGELLPTDAGGYVTTLSAARLPIGSYPIHAAALLEDGTLTTSAPLTLTVSAPVYVVWSFDWEGNDVSNDFLARVDSVLGRHNNIPVVHFFSPRIFIADEIAPERARYLKEWVQARADLRGDEIQLHLHMQDDQWRAIGIDPKALPKWGKFSGGYDVMTFAYSYEEVSSLLGWAKSQFEQNGLGTPTGYRAGGWMADEALLRALEDQGFVYDASGHEKKIWGKEYEWFPWALEDTTQPYFPSDEDQNTPATTPGGLLEFPNNGGDSWYYEAQDSIAKFNANFSGAPQPSPVVVSFVTHPQWIDREGERMDQTLTHIDQFRASTGSGPVVYVTYADIIDLYKK